MFHSLLIKMTFHQFVYDCGKRLRIIYDPLYRIREIKSHCKIYVNVIQHFFGLVKRGSKNSISL